MPEDRGTDLSQANSLTCHIAPARVSHCGRGAGSVITPVDAGRAPR
ncbi:MAG: hypothetical protein WC804_18855 [Sphingomonas sp.]|jgi:hypothetical protein